MSFSLSGRERGTSQHVRGVDTDRDRYRLTARELKRDCVIPGSFTRFNRLRLKTTVHRVNFRLIIQISTVFRMGENFDINIERLDLYCRTRKGLSSESVETLSSQFFT